MSEPTVLLVEDDPAISQFVQASLQAQGYGVHLCTTARDAEALAAMRPVDIFLVDLGLPDDDGLNLIRRLRGWTQRPVIVLSARSLEMQKVQALDAGADDYLVKPFGVSELHARLRVARRLAARTTPDADNVLPCAGGLRVDLTTSTARRGDEVLKLTGTEWRLLEALARRADRVVSARQLMADVWGPGHAEQGHYLRVYIRALRVKLEPDPGQPAVILTDPGLGYRLVTTRTG